MAVDLIEAKTGTPSANASGPLPEPEARDVYRQLALFYAIALLFSWTVWLPLAAGRWGWIAPQSAWLHLIGSLGPAVAAFIMAARAQWLPALLSALSPRRLTRAGIGFAVMFPAAIGAAGLLAQSLVLGAPPAWREIFESVEFPDFSPVALALSSLVFYGFGEEIGWRGYMLPRLLVRMSPFSAALWGTLPWALWHLPLLLSNPTYQALGVAGLAGWLVSLLTGSLLMTWLFLGFGRSLIAVAVFHAVLDLAMVNPAVSSLGLNVMGALITLAGLWAAWALWPVGGTPRRGARPADQG